MESTNNSEKNGFENLFSKRLRETRTNRKIQQKEFADKIGISANALSNYETGKRIPTADILKKIAVFLGVSADYLLGVSDENTIRDVNSEEITIEDVVKSIIILSRLNDSEIKCDYQYPYCEIQFCNKVLSDFLEEYKTVQELMKNPDFADYLKNGLRDTLIKKYSDKCAIDNGEIYYKGVLKEVLTEDDLPF